jgi:hypothetical protein
MQTRRYGTLSAKATEGSNEIMKFRSALSKHWRTKGLHCWHILFLPLGVVGFVLAIPCMLLVMGYLILSDSMTGLD